MLRTPGRRSLYSCDHWTVKLELVVPLTAEGCAFTTPPEVSIVMASFCQWLLLIGPVFAYKVAEQPVNCAVPKSANGNTPPE